MLYILNKMYLNSNKYFMMLMMKFIYLINKEIFLIKNNIEVFSLCKKYLCIIVTYI